MNPSDIQPWLSVLALLISVGGTLYLWLSSGSRNNTAAIKEIDERVVHLEQSVSGIQIDMRHLPSKDGIQRMEIQLAEMSGQMAVLSERMKPIAAISDRLQEMMMEPRK